MKESQGQTEAFVRWQERLLEQRATLNNLLLGIGVATLGYQVNLVFGEDKLCFYGWWEQLYFEFSSPTLALSIIFGLLMGFTRFIDYNLTAKLNRLKSSDQIEGLKEIRRKAKGYAKATKLFFGFQTGSVILGFFF